MFNSKKNNYSVETLIGEKCNINGSLTGTGSIEIEGYVEGDIYWDDDIMISETCTVKGSINCVDAYIKGRINGDIISKRVLTIESTGQVYGNIHTPKLIIKEGGIFKGVCSMPIIKTSHEDLILKPFNKINYIE
jgi:cytoskeletal protein CcmA (bactofilin family)